MNYSLFLSKNKETLFRGCDGTGLFPSVAMAQMAQESTGNYGEYGLSLIAARNHNYWGMKYAPWQAAHGVVPDVPRSTTEDIGGKVGVVIRSSFGVFKSFEHCLKFRAILFNSVRVYRVAKVLQAKTPEDQIQRIKSAGYATDVNYVPRLLRQLSNFKYLDAEFASWKKKSINPSLR